MSRWIAGTSTETAHLLGLIQSYIGEGTMINRQPGVLVERSVAIGLNVRVHIGASTRVFGKI